MNSEDKIELIKEYSIDHPNFNLDFIDSLEDAISTYGDLTSNQDEALDNIISKYRMIQWLER
jgi:hypothetical protein